MIEIFSIMMGFVSIINTVIAINLLKVEGKK